MTTELQPQHQQHGVMVVIDNFGVLICGDPGIGKSSLALAILQQGGQLVADDLVLIRRNNQSLMAQCSENAQGLLHSRELGLIDINSLFGTDAIIEQHRLDGIVNLSKVPPNAVQSDPLTTSSILGLAIPTIQLSVVNPLPVINRLQIWLQHLRQNRSLESFNQTSSTISR